MTEDKMAGWHHQLNERELGQTLGDGDGQESWHAAVCRLPESDTTRQHRLGGL